MKTALYYLGLVWLWIVGASVIFGSLAILFTQGVWKFWEVMSPFNFINWIVIAILAAPGVALVHFSGKDT